VVKLVALDGDGEGVVGQPGIVEHCAMALHGALAGHALQRVERAAHRPGDLGHPAQRSDRRPGGHLQPVVGQWHALERCAIEAVVGHLKQPRPAGPGAPTEGRGRGRVGHPVGDDVHRQPQGGLPHQALAAQSQPASAGLAQCGRSALR